jgi:hypothetical protein
VGCSPKATTALTQAEIDTLNKLHGRLNENRGKLARSLDDLNAVGAEALQDQHTLSLSLSKAKLLESMRSPWSNPDADMAATQKEVAFYQLYALAEAEQDLLQKRLRTRRESIDRIAVAYDRMSTLTTQMIECEKLVLADINKPADAQVIAFVNQLLVEAKAFRETLAASDNPKLQQLAKDVEKAESRVEKARDAAEQAFLKLKGK